MKRLFWLFVFPAALIFYLYLALLIMNSKAVARLKGSK